MCRVREETAIGFGRPQSSQGGETADHVIRLRPGDILAAGVAHLLDGDEVSLDQSALTSQLLPASRKSGDAVFSGSIVRRGEIGELVYVMGGKTYSGRSCN
jgi:H+-transporting ATPase